jgi:hypothetical protein
LPSSASRITLVSSTCTTQSAPAGTGAPVLILTHWPGCRPIWSPG